MPRATAQSNYTHARHPGHARLRTRGLPMLLALVSALFFSVSALALRSDRDQPINIVADTSEVDAKTGYTRITGGVVITQGTLVVHADEARVYVNEGRVNRVELDGVPATWAQTLESGEDMNARAQHIDYDVPGGTIELTGDARVDHPQGEISGASLQYELDTEKLRGLSQGSDRVRIRIDPDAVDQHGLLNSNRPANGGDNNSSTNAPAPTDDAATQETDDDDGNSGSGAPAGNTPGTESNAATTTTGY